MSWLHLGELSLPWLVCRELVCLLPFLPSHCPSFPSPFKPVSTPSSAARHLCVAEPLLCAVCVSGHSLLLWHSLLKLSMASRMFLFTPSTWGLGKLVWWPIREPSAVRLE